MTDSFFEQRVHVPEGVLVQNVSGEAVLLNLQTEHYYGLDEVGARMWEVLTSTPTIDAAVAQLLNEYEVGEDTLRTDMRALVVKLAENGLLELR